jgi:hypothetical protein
MKTNTRFLMVWCLFFLASYAGFGQSSFFSKVIYDPYGGVQAYCIEKTMDHGFIIAGEKDNLAFVSKIDSTGSVLWSKTFGSNDGTFWCLTATRDSCFVLAGFADNPGDTASDLLCVKINSAGDTLWTRMIDMGYHEEVISIRQTLDNGYILTGDASGEKVVVVKLNASGNLSWGKLFSIANYSNVGCGADQTPDTGYIVTGFTENNINYPPVMYLMKLTSTGTVSWTKQKNDTSYINSWGYDVHVVQGGIMTLFYASNGGWTLMKTDLSGNVLWGKSYTANFFTQAGHPNFRLHQTSDAGYVFVTGNPFMGSMMKVDSTGNLLFSQSLVLNSADIVESYSGVYSIVGNGPLWGEKQKQSFVPQVGVIKTDSSGSGSDCITPGDVSSYDYSASFSDVACTIQSAGTAKHLTGPVTNLTMSIVNGCVDRTGGINELKPSISINVFPNPNDGVFSITVDEGGQNEVQLVEVYNIPGERVYVSSDPSVLLSPINIGWVQEGVYNVKVSFKTTSCSQKILICH